MPPAKAKGAGKKENGSSQNGSSSQNGATSQNGKPLSDTELKELKSNGKGKAAAKVTRPRPGKKGQSGSGGFPVVVVIGAVVVAALAWFAYDSLSQAPAPPEAAAGRAKQQKPPKGRKGKELTPHELRQQGQRVPGSDRPQCRDGMGCSGVSAEDCADGRTKARCASAPIAPRARAAAASRQPRPFAAAAAQVLPLVLQEDVRRSRRELHRMGTEGPVLPQPRVCCSAARPHLLGVLRHHHLPLRPLRRRRLLHTGT
jgi:hypothetical protein